MAYDTFETFHRPSDMNIIDYINKFEWLYNQIKRYDIEITNGVLAYRVLKNANISNEKQQLVQATLTSLTYENMKKQLKAIYESYINLASNDNIKEEQIFLTQDKKGHVGSERYPKDSKYNCERYHKTRYKGVTKNSRESFDKWGRKTNPKDNFGNISCCAVCQSIYHWAKQCPDRRQEEDDNIKVFLFSKEIHDYYITKFVGETMNGAVLDSGCTQNVCGLSWLNSYLESLTDDDKSKVIENESHTVFKLGDGKSFKSLKSVTIPAKAGHKKQMLTDVIDRELPLLLSKKEMKMAKAKTDFDNDIINIFEHGIKISLTASGIVLYQLVEQTKQLLILLRTTTVEDLSSLVLLIYLQNHTMKNLRSQES